MKITAIAFWTGLMLSTGMIHAQSDSIPFTSIEILDDYEPWMDTLMTTVDTIELYVYAEHCLELNGEFVDYFDMADDVEICVGSVIDLIPGDSVNVYYWSTASPAAGSTDGDVAVSLYLAKNTSSASIEYNTTEGEDSQEGTLSFLNENVDYDLVVFRISDLEHEYRIRYSFDTYTIRDTTTVTSDGRKDENFSEPGIRFYPNPVRDQACFETGKELMAYEVYDMEGRRIHLEGYPQLNGEGLYSLDLGLLDPGIRIIRFRYTDHTMETVRIKVE
ncbi:MAG: hypothetical protein GY790_17390 [Bacteroidetes bacterium]|nr:hypothetical protein [Bacteroidota bacterium]